MSAKKKPDDQQQGQRPLLYRDGIPIAEKSPEEQEAIWWRHIDPDHADYNPAGQTTGATTTIAIKLHELDLSARKGRKAGGRQRGAQQRAHAEAAAEPIYAKYRELVSEGVPPHKRVSKVAEWAQRSAAHNHLDVRQIRRAIERLKKKDSS